MKISEIISAIEAVAPLAMQEDWDNSGMQVGDRNAECTGVTVCVDPTPEVLDEAVANGCNLVVSHHPLIFGPLKRIVGDTLQQRVVIEALKRGVAVYSSHTALDNSPHGVSAAMASMLGLRDVEILEPRQSDMLKLTLYVPTSHLDLLRTAVADAGAGRLGNYDSCSFAVEGSGSYRPLAGSNPWAGSEGRLHTEPETRLEAIVPRWLKKKVEAAIRRVHPYEEPAYEFQEVTVGSVSGGLGCVGNLASEMTAREFAELAKRTFGCGGIRCSLSAVSNRPVRRVALCGGAGGSLLRSAIASGAQMYVSADLRYHDYVDHGAAIGMVDVGHFNSEECAKTIFYQLISEKFPNFALYSAKNEKNPIEYL